MISFITDGFLQCSCKIYERYGYPCHHLLHVCGCQSIHDIKKEWIDISWSKDYLLQYLHHDTDSTTNVLYANLKNLYPIGIHHIVPDNQTYPIYKGSEVSKFNTSTFDVPTFQFMSQNSKMLWIEKNNTNDPQLKLLLNQKDSDFVASRIFLSQEQQKNSNVENNTSTNLNDCHNNDEESDSVTSNTCDFMDYTENHALLKRAFQLANRDELKHEQLYTLLSDFVYENEVNHNDNDNVIDNREQGVKVIVSSNKIINKSRRSNKRKKGSWEC